jgi:Ca-activated chloride channel family protein
MNVGARALALLIAASALAPPRAQAQAWSILRSDNDHVTEGNARMAAGDAKAALESYDRAARELPSEGGVHLNRGIALLKSGDTAKAREALELALQSKATPDTRADANYDLGLAFYKEADAAAGKEDHAAAQQQFREAADSFKQALRLRPGDRNSAWNYELALRRIREQKEKQEQKEQAEQDEQKQEKNEGEQDPNQQPRDGEQGDSDQTEPKPGEDPQAKKPEEPKADGQKPQDKPPENEPRPEPQQAQQQPQPAQPRSESERALDALQDGEENLERMKAMRRAARERRVPEKDW